VPTDIAGRPRRVDRLKTWRLLTPGWGAVCESVDMIIAYHLLNKGTVYEDLGSIYFDEHDKTVTVNRALARIRRLGYEAHRPEYLRLGGGGSAPRAHAFARLGAPSFAD
jgi:hypothetical protein